MPKPRILRTIPNFYPYVTGPANQAWQVASRLAGDGYGSTILTSDHRAKDAPAEEQREGVWIHRLPEGPGVLAYRWVRGARRWLAEAEYELIHAHSYRNYLTSLAHRTVRRRGVPYVLQPHGQLLMYRHFLGAAGSVPYRVYDTATGKREVLDADAVILATEQEREEALAFGVKAERAHVIPVGVAARDEPGKERGGDERLTVLFVGRLSPDRNLEQVLHALAKLPASAQQAVRVRFVGGGGNRSRLNRGESYPARLRRLAGELGVSKMCEFVGPLYGEDLDAAYAEADVFVYPSRYENFGQTVLEAAGHGLPVIATATGVARDVVVEGNTGHLVPLDDASALSDRLRHLIEDREAIAHMGRTMFEQVQSAYQWPRIVDRYVTLYEWLLSR